MADKKEYIHVPWGFVILWVPKWICNYIQLCISWHTQQVSLSLGTFIQVGMENQIIEAEWCIYASVN